MHKRFPYVMNRILKETLVFLIFLILHGIYLLFGIIWSRCLGEAI
nr:MAG TPA: hypothetical protein [Caudoviricetes sp.]